MAKNKANHKLLNPKIIDSLKAKDEQYVIWDTKTKAFGVRVSPGGTKSYVLLYQQRNSKKKKWYTLGRAKYKENPNGIDLATARIEAEIAKQNVKHERAPEAEDKAKKAKKTVDELIDEYLESKEGELRSLKERKRILDKDVRPAIGYKLVTSVEREDIRNILNRIIARGAKSQAKATQRIIHILFEYAIDDDIIDVTPAVRLKKTKEEPRERFFSLDEIRLFLENIDNAAMGKATRIALKLILVTAQRPGEVCTLEWSEIDPDQEYWNLPSEKAKNKKAHKIPLSTLAREILQEAKELSPNATFVFPSRPSLTRATKGHMTVNSLSQAVGRWLRKTSLIEHFTPHDLRRTFASHAGDLRTKDIGAGSIRVSRDTISLVLNHTPQNVTTKHYNHGEYLEDKKMALDLWTEKLEEMIKTGNKGG